jgi:tRNA(Ile)-lysidine synthase
MDLVGVQGEQPDTLSVSQLRGLEPHRQCNLIRFWLQSLGLPLPPTTRLQSVLDDAISAAWDRNPRIAWSGAEIRRYRDRLYAMAPLPAHDPTQVRIWDMRGPLTLPYGSLWAEPALGIGLSAAACERLAVSVRFRQGGERCQPASAPYTRPLKHLLQEHGVPPWLRAYIPLVYLGEELAAVGDLWVCRPLAAQAGEAGRVIRWERGRCDRDDRA